MNSEIEDMGISLLEKGRKGISSVIFSRFGLILVLLLLQVGILFGIFRWFGDFLPHIYGVTIVLAFSMIVYLLNSRMDPTAKLTWLVENQRIQGAKAAETLTLLCAKRILWKNMENLR